MNAMGSGSGQPTFLRALITLFSGTVLAQTIPFLLSPVIARLYNAEQFAVFGTLIAVFNMLNVIAAGRYDQTVLLPNSEKEAGNLVRGASLVVLLSTAIVAGVLLVLGQRLEQVIALNGLQELTWPLVVLTFFGGLQLVLLQWLLRMRAFGVIARQKVLQAIAVTVLTILFGWLAWRNGLVTGYVFGWAIYTVATFMVVFRHYPLSVDWDLSAIRKALSAYKDWPLHNAWPALLNAIASGLAVIFMVSFYNVQVAGEHNFARQYLLVPIGMVSVALGQVLFERTASRVREGLTIRDDLWRVARVLMLLAVVMVLVVWFFGEFIFGFVFGEQWHYAGDLAGILIWGYATQFVVSPFGIQLIALRKVKAAMLFPVFFAGLLALLPFFRGLPAERFMMLLSAVEVVAYGAYGLLVWYHVERYERKLLLERE